LAAASRLILGIDKDDDEDYREYMPHWSKNSQLVYLSRGADGKPGQYINMGYTDPYAYLKEPVLAFLRGDNWKERLWEGFVSLSSPFLSEDILTQKVLDVSRNQRGDGYGPVYNPQDTDWNKLSASAMHVMSSLEPGTLTQLRKMHNYATQGDTGALAREAVAFGTGIRIEPIDMPKTLGYSSRDYQKGLIDAGRIFSREVYKPNNTGNVVAGYQAANEARRALFYELHTKVMAARRQGLDDRTVALILHRNGITKRDIKLLLAGVYYPYKPTDELLKKLEKEQRLDALQEYQGAVTEARAAMAR
jgi:hypothetical protein